MPTGGRIVIVTDGVTEAENPTGDMYGADRLSELYPNCGGIEDVFSSVFEFCAGQA